MWPLVRHMTISTKPPDKHTGDRLTLVNPLSLEEHQVEIVENNYASAIYTQPGKAGHSPEKDCRLCT